LAAVAVAPGPATAADVAAPAIADAAMAADVASTVAVIRAPSSTTTADVVVAADVEAVAAADVAGRCSP
jgi:hypothetical protein